MLLDKTVLIVDDNATNRRIPVPTSRVLGYAARGSRKKAGRALAWMAQGTHFDLGVLDMQMPDMDGLIWPKGIRQTHSGDDLPLILLTSWGIRWLTVR